ncbi:cytochrome P450 [Xylaria venustula]|nr:cytochrome P450 [Xylaria venustula]
MNDTAHIEIGQIAAGVVNTSPSAFWMIWQVFSNPVVLDDCQREVAQLVKTSPDGVCSIDLAQARTSCPVLVSTWQEVLRFHGTSVTARIVQEDTTVDAKYLLKRGGVVLMPNEVIHTAAFRGFGGGHVLCLGRHFASTEVLALVALLLVRFDVHPIGGTWIEPPKHNVMDRAFPLLKGDVEVEIVSKGVQRWQISFSDSRTGVNIIAEDLE